MSATDEVIDPDALPDPPLYLAAEIRRLELGAAAAGLALMERAGAAAAQLIDSLIPDEDPVLFLAGPGNNGGDAWVAARLLHARGRAVTLVCRADPAGLPADAAAARLAYVQAGGAVQADIPARQTWSLAVDGLFGVGLTRPVRGQDARLIEHINALPCPRLALDLPSGLSADNGRALGRAVAAQHTLAFLGLKPGYYGADGPEHCGTLHLASLGLAQQAWVYPRGRLITGAPALPRRARDSHKGKYGRIGIVGGAPGWAGAALLAARAVLAAGGGLVAAGLLDGRLAIDPGQPEVMLRSAEELAAGSGLDVLAVGPGLGQDGRAQSLLKTALTCVCPLVLDADALNLLAIHPALMNMAAERAVPTVITPHPGEAARLLGADTEAVQGDRLGCARALARRLHAWTVLKGLGSIVAAPEGENYWVNASGHPALAAPGMGDVLTGLIAARLARLPVQPALTGAVWLHGKAGEDGAAWLGGAEGLRAGEVVELVRSRINRGASAASGPNGPGRDGK